MSSKPKLLAVLVNYGTEQIQYLERMVASFKSFQKYNVRVVVHSNIPLDVPGIDEVKVLELEDYQLLPSTCRKTIWEAREDYDYFIFAENDILYEESHIDNFVAYEKILPANRIAGLLRIEKYDDENFYMDYHTNFEWDFENVEVYGGKVFAHFDNLHHAGLLLSQKQLLSIGKKWDFNRLQPDPEFNFVPKLERFVKRSILGQEVQNPPIYSVKCKVGTDAYKYGGMRKMICISDFDQSLIYHMPNLYKKGEKGRYQLGSGEERMRAALQKLNAAVKD